MPWVKKETNRITFDTPKVVTGTIISVEPTRFDVNGYKIQLKDGSVMSFLGTAVLDQLIGNEEGNLVKIEYLGEERLDQGRRLKRFNVEVWREEENAESLA